MTDKVKFAAQATLAIAFAFALTWVQYQHIFSIGGHKAADAPRFTLTDHHGRAVTEASYRGKYLLVYFGYTFCPDVCPTSLSTITESLDILGSPAGAIVPILITIDPERDKTGVLADYVAAFSPHLMGLNGTPDQIYDVAGQFGVIYARNGNGDNYTMDHSANLYLISPDGYLMSTIRHGVPVQELVELLSKEIVTAAR